MIEALQDLRDGFGHWRLWSFHAWLEIKQRYRRSVLGPFWLTLSMGLTVGVLGTVYGAIFSLSVAEYLPYLTLGFIMWSLWSGLLNEGCTVFVEMEGFVKQSQMPFSLYVLRLAWMQVIIFAHNFVVFIVVALLFGVAVNSATLLVLPGLVLLVANAFGWMLLLGVACARFRDIPPLIASVLQLGFFATPILFRAEQAGGRAFLVEYNPFFYLVEIIRAPLLGTWPHPGSWQVLIAMALFANLAGFAVFARYRRRIAYWL